MFERSHERKRRLGVQWIRSEETGESYLCPVGVLEDPNNASEEELRRYCVVESQNPQND